MLDWLSQKTVDIVPRASLVRPCWVYMQEREVILFIIIELWPRKAKTVDINRGDQSISMSI
jgi:hypothetical protein